MSKVVSKDGTEIAFEQVGAGRPIILVDGAFGYRGFGPMTPLAPLLAPHFTAITYDRRGRGESGDTAPYAVEREIEDIQALITAVGGSAFVYGISSGAALALRASNVLPAISKLALYEMPLVLDDSRPPVPPDYLAHFQALLAAGQGGDMVAYFMTAGVGIPAEAVAGMRGMPMWPALEAIAHTLIYDTMCMGDFTLSPALTTRTAPGQVPTLVMGGGASPPWLHHAVRALAEAIPGAQLRMLPDQTHEVDPAVLAPVLLEFFQS